MRPIRRLLVAVKDPMAQPLPAVAKAIQLARAFGAELEFFHTLDTSLYVDMLDMEETRLLPPAADERAQFLQRLERIAARARLHGVKVTVAAEWDYPVPEAIVRRAATIDADLIVAECHLGRHIAAGLRGLADRELVRLSPVPVLLVKERRPYYRPTVLAAVDPGHTFSKPVKLDEEILRLGAAVAGALRGKLHAVHACASAPANFAMIDAATAARFPPLETTAANRRFEQLLAQSDVPPARRHLLAGCPSDGVRLTARHLHSAIVVMGAISRSGLKGVFIGNTAERLLGQLPCDLLVVKPAQFENNVARERPGPHVARVAPLF